MSYAQRLIRPPESVIARNRNNIQTTPVDMLAFPSGNFGGHGIIFNFSKYTYDKNADLQNKVVSDSIMLPIPANLVDSFNVRINQAELGLSGSAAARTGATTTASDFSTFGGAVSTAVDAALSELQEASQDTSIAAVKALETLASEEDRKGFEVGFGKAVNPHLALSFDGVDLKQHQFQWELAPRNAGESEQLKRIINKFKRNSLPKFAQIGSGRNMFEYPNVVDTFFVGTEPGFLYYFKRCLIGTFEVNYAAGGTPAFLEGGRPAAVNISMTMTEMDIHTADDYDDELQSIIDDTRNALG